MGEYELFNKLKLSVILFLIVVSDIPVDNEILSISNLKFK